MKAWLLDDFKFIWAKRRLSFTDGLVAGYVFTGLVLLPPCLLLIVLEVLR